MAFLEKVTEVFNTTSKDVVDKAKEIKDVVALNSQLSAQENLVKKYFAEMGQCLYEHRDQDVSAMMSERYALVDAAYEEIARLKKELLDKKGLKACPVCGSELDKGAAYCSKCGAPVPVEEPAEPAAEAPETAEQPETECCCKEETAEAECCCKEEAAEEAECCCKEEAAEECCCKEEPEPAEMLLR